jgi:NAD(P)-dependent dehydrogenase (short-subunit alcohol dehydrogenase family)
MVEVPSLVGRRVLNTGAARGIGAALAARLHQKGARVALAGLEPELLGQTAACGDGPWWGSDVTDRDQVAAALAGAVSRGGRGGLSCPGGWAPSCRFGWRCSRSSTGLFLTPGRRAGVVAADVQRVIVGPGADGWTDRWSAHD